MTDYTWPTEIIPASSEWSYVSNVAAFISPLTGATRTLGRGGDRWQCSLIMPTLTNANRSILRAYLAKLRGRTHRAIIGDHSYLRRGTQSANVTVNGAGQTGYALNITGATIGATLLAGDYFTVGNELKMITADATANGSGQMALAFVPALRVSPAGGAAVTITAPTGRFILTGDAGWSNSPGYLSGFSCSFIEDIA